MSTTSDRSPYTRPELRRYGAITKLVQGGSGSKTDKDNPMSHNSGGGGG
jgi:hypothetical protein